MSLFIDPRFLFLYYYYPFVTSCRLLSLIFSYFKPSKGFSHKVSFAPVNYTFIHYDLEESQLLLIQDNSIEQRNLINALVYYTENEFPKYTGLNYLTQSYLTVIF